jgi:tRNA(fMet)-specific endonuclease VapC
MRLQYLIESDWAVWWLRQRSDVVAAVKAREQDGLAMSIITLAELYEGIELTRDPAAGRKGLQDFLQLITILPVTPRVTELFGKEAARLERLGQRIPDFDLVIGVTALHHGLTLLAEDAHFDRLPSLVRQSLSSPSPG